MIGCRGQNTDNPKGRECNMKKILLLIALGIVLSVSGCSKESTEETTEAADVKKCRLDIYSADDSSKVLLTIDDQETVNKLLDMSKWERETTDVPQNMTGKYGIVVWQEKVLPEGQKTDEENEYEMIETITTFEGNSFIELVYSQNAVRNAIPISNIAFYYSVPDEFLETLQKAIDEKQ